MMRPAAGEPLTPEALGHVRGVTFTVPAGVFRAMLTGLQHHPGQLMHGDLGLRWHLDRAECLWRSSGLVHAGDVYALQRSPQHGLTYTVEMATLSIGRPQVWQLLALTAGPAPPAPPTLQVVLGSGLPAPIQIVVSRGQVQPPYAQILYYQTTDCTGTPALYSGAGPLPRGQILGSVLYYPTSPRTADRPFMSTETEQTPCGGTPTPRGTCCTTQARSESPADAASIPLSTLGLTLPFTVVASP